MTQASFSIDDLPILMPEARHALVDAPAQWRTLDQWPAHLADLLKRTGQAHERPFIYPHHTGVYPEWINIQMRLWEGMKTPIVLSRTEDWEEHSVFQMPSDLVNNVFLVNHVSDGYVRQGGHFYSGILIGLFRAHMFLPGGGPPVARLLVLASTLDERERSVHYHHDVIAPRGLPVPTHLAYRALAGLDIGRDADVLSRTIQVDWAETGSVIEMPGSVCAEISNNRFPNLA